MTRGIDTVIVPLRTLYAAMERAYDELSGHYGFDCKGCEDNCCTQRFYHHTLTEHYYLLKGLNGADKGLAREILSRAKTVTGTYREEVLTGRILLLMCPVNFDGLCALYKYRPMICRLHGLPHEFTRPDVTTTQGGGCHRFESSHRTTRRLNRTGFYTELAGLEKQLRASLGFNGRYKKTTAQILTEGVTDTFESGG